MSAIKIFPLNSEYSQPSSLQKKSPKVWAIGGGKGGIGKSFISSSLAIYLAQTSKKTVVIDLDLGGANLHTCLGAEVPSRTLSDFVRGHAKKLSDLVVPTGIMNLEMISGAQDALDIANVESDICLRIMNEARNLEAEHVIIDLGAGTSSATLDFFVNADRSIVAITPEPTSIENAYRFIKAAMFQKLKHAETQAGIQSLIDEAMDQRNRYNIRSPSDLVRHVENISPEIGKVFRTEIEKMKLNIVINQARTQSDADLGLSIQSVCRRYFGIHSTFVGAIDYDNAVWQALRRKRPLLIDNPNTYIVGQLSRIVKNLIDPHVLQGVK
jgi:flagellar biosynthesis protein FlhG